MVSTNALSFKIYLTGFDNLISTFANVAGYKEFQKNIRTCIILIQQEINNV